MKILILFLFKNLYGFLPEPFLAHHLKKAKKSQSSVIDHVFKSMQMIIQGSLHIAIQNSSSYNSCLERTLPTIEILISYYFLIAALLALLLTFI